MKEQEDLGTKLGDFYRTYKSADSSKNLSIKTEIEALSQRYEILEPIGEGGLKSVWAALDLKTGRDLALAYPKEKNDESVEMLLHEARVTAALNHPNIIPVYDIECEADVFFTMKKLGGGNLYDLLKKKNFRNDSWFLLQVFSRVCDALAFSHSKGVIHLDVKPDNIQVDDYGTVLLIDWGLAASFSTEEGRHVRSIADQDDLICGTIGYISPEQVNCQEGIVDERSDIYALGGLLHYILTGEIALDNQLSAPFERVKKGELNLFVKGLELPEGLRAITKKAMDLDAGKRYQSVAELKDDLDRYLNGFATFAENAGFLKQLNLLIKRNKKICLVAGSVSFLVMSLIISFVYQLNNEKKATERALEETHRLKVKSDELRQEAIANLEMFKAEEQDKMMMVKSSADILVEQALSKVHIIGVDEALRRVDLALKAWPESENVKFKKIHILFIGQRFKEVVNELEGMSRGPYLDKLYNLSKTYLSQTALGDSLQPKAFIQLLTDLRDKELFWLIKILVMLEKHDQSGTSIENALNYFKLLYPSQNKVELIRAQGIVSLKAISSGDFIDFSVFSGQKFKSLDLSQLKLVSFKSLRYIEIEELILKGKRKLNLSQLNEVSGLKKVIIKGGQFQVPEQAVLDESIQLIFEP